MAALGPLSPSTAVSTAGTWGINWVNPTNALTSNNVRSTYTFNGQLSNSSGYAGFLTVRNFGINLPADAIIHGITVQVEVIQSGGSTGTTRLESIYLTKNGTSNIGTNKGNTTVLTTTESTQTLGGAADKWGTTWTAAELNSPSFGVRIRPLGSTSGTNRVVGIDYVSVTVEYEANTVISVDPFGFNQTSGGDVFVANGAFEFIASEPLAFAMGSLDHNIPETIPVTTKAFVLSGQDIEPAVAYARDTGVKFFQYVLPAATGTASVWTDIENSLIEDGSYASIDGRLTGGLNPRPPLRYLFEDVGIPKIDGVVKGIEVRVKGKQEWSTQQNATTIGIGNSSKNAIWPSNNVDGTIVLGGPNDNWGISNLKQLASVPALVLATGANTFYNQFDYIDFVSIRVWYAAIDPYSVAGATPLESPDNPAATAAVNYTGVSGAYVDWTSGSENGILALSTPNSTSTADVYLGQNQLSKAFVKPLSEFESIPTDATIVGIHIEWVGYTGSSGAMYIGAKAKASSGAQYTSVSTGTAVGSTKYVYATTIDVNWAPGQWDTTGSIGIQAASGTFGSGNYTLDYYAVRVSYVVDPSEKMPVLAFTQSGLDAQALGASAVQVDTRAYAFTPRDVNVKGTERIPVDRKAFTETRLNALVVEKQLVPVRAFAQTRLDVKVNERIPVTPRAFTMGEPNIKVNETQRIDTLSFAQTSLDHNVSGASLYEIDTLNYVQTELSVGINATEIIAVAPRAFAQSEFAPNLNAKEGVAIPTRQFVQTGLDVGVYESTAIIVGVKPFTQALLVPNLNAKEGVAVPVRVFSQNYPVLTINEGASIGVPVLEFAQTGLNANTNAREKIVVPMHAFSQEEHVAETNSKTKIDVSTLSSAQATFGVNVNERIPLGVKAFIQTTQVVKVNDRVGIPSLAIGQTEYDVKLNERIGVQTKNFTQTARVVKTNEVINSFGNLEIVQTTYEVAFPEIVRVETAALAMELLNVVVPTVLNVGTLAFTQFGAYPTIYNDLVPTLIGRIRWTQWVEGPEGKGSMLKEFVETATFSIGDRARYTLPEVPRIGGQLLEDEGDGIPVVVEV